ncbi:MAG: N-6 DNA methylase [Acidobacteriota bacterium]
MTILYDIVKELTSSALPETDRIRTLNDFAYHFGWAPSNSLDTSSVSEFANAHLVVEHGLENTAVITFLRNRFSELGLEQRQRLLNISYNNLVDWHIQVEPDQVIYVFNRAYPAKIVSSHRVSRDELDYLKSKAFEEVAGQKQNPNLPALDDALIDTIAFWKRALSAEMNHAVTNDELSALFNAIIFVRAVEDHFRRIYRATSNGPFLLDPSLYPAETRVTFCEVILTTLSRLGQSQIPSYLIDESKLRVFDNLEMEVLVSLFQDFYRIKKARPYEYDFSVMSKHALSRIYERYTNLLRISHAESAQASFFEPLPEEEPNIAYGSIYTPQFIARFFARYLREQIPPFAFKRLHTLEPAVGSGIFLRTLLEIQCDPVQNGVTTEQIESIFRNVVGLDRDPNACHAALLSLSLLHLVLTNHLPPDLEILDADAISFLLDHPEMKASREVVIANPPFISWKDLSQSMREQVSSFMGDDASGRIDLYLAFLKIAVEVLKPGGYGLFVLPHNFLLGNHALRMRNQILETSWIRCLVDLSTVRVFENTGSYIVLLIFQKRYNVEPEPQATIVKCHELVGQALQDTVEGHQVENQFYSIYNTPQSAFAGPDWIIANPTEAAINRKLSTLPTLDRFLEIHKGLITGKDKVFIVSKGIVRKLEKKIFIPFLPDREMMSYVVPETTDWFVFYPFIDGRKIEEKELQDKFPKTHKYLAERRKVLEDRPPVRRGQLAWWQPERPRVPEQLIRPKIVSPHLVVMPRFSLDRVGKYAIAQAPLMYPKAVIVENDLLRYLSTDDFLKNNEETEITEVGSDDSLLRYFLAILNSSLCYRLIAERSHKYGGGYAKLEPRTLGKTPVPDPSSISPSTMWRLLSLVDRRLIAPDSEIIKLESEIDEIVAELYGFTSKEKESLGMLSQL